jgi:hypothetical protein
MNIERIRSKLEKELAKRNLRLVWDPEPAKLGPNELVVFGAEDVVREGEKPLTTGIGPIGSGEQFGNSPEPVVEEHLKKFLEALAAAGIPQTSLHSSYSHTGRGKIWPTFVARLTLETFNAL